MEETLSQFVKRIMDQRNFGVREVERNSGKKITASHVSKILNGSVTNLTADKIVGLALGLKVDPHEVFSVISGHLVKEGSSPDLMRFADVIQQLAANPTLFDTVEELSRMQARDQSKALTMMRFINKRSKKPERKKKKR